MAQRACDTLRARIEERTARIAVIGLGYVGLPLAVEIARAGFEVVGIERNRDRVASVGRGENYIGDVLPSKLAEVLASGRLSATDEFSVVGDADVITLCVPTPLDANKQPDTQHIRHVVRRSLPHVRSGQLFVLESTTYPGTTDEVLRPRLESTGLTIGEELFLAYSPERIDPGNRHFQTRNTPRVVGGTTAACTELARAFYAAILESDVVTVSSAKVAEMAKLLENVYRIVNISLVNELALLCERMGIDIWEVIEAAKTKPFGFMPFYPGPGLGGHCIPLDPFYLSWRARAHGFTTRFIDLAGQINDAMPYHVVERVSELLNEAERSIRGARILILGLAYKADVDDVRESPGLKIAQLLADRGALLLFHDPHVREIDRAFLPPRSEPLTADLLRNVDLALITTAHATVDYASVAEHAPLVFDTRNATRGLDAAHIVRLGVG